MLVDGNAGRRLRSGIGCSSVDVPSDTADES